MERSSSRSGQCRPNGDSSMLLSCAGVAWARRGFSAARNRSFVPLSRTTKTNPSWNPAVLGASIKVLMPLVDDKPSMFLGKLLRSGKLAGFQSERLTKLDSFLDIEHRFASTITDMDMNGAMIVAVKKETIAVLLEDCRHGLIVARQGIRRRFLFCRSCRSRKRAEIVAGLTVSGVPLWSSSVSSPRVRRSIRLWIFLAITMASACRS